MRWLWEILTDPDEGWSEVLSVTLWAAIMSAGAWALVRALVETGVLR